MPHPETDEPVLVTREEILEHADADQRVLEAAHRYTEKQARWHGRLIRALRPYCDDSRPSARRSTARPPVSGSMLTVVASRS